MKTLDEVIKANECCDHGEPDSRCEDCPYNGIGACCAERESDALHYLKEYRNKEMFYNQSVDHMVQIINEHEDRVCAYLAEMRKNDPLTWDELRTMEGKPVWFESEYYKTKQWGIITFINDNDLSAIGYDNRLVTEIRAFKDDNYAPWQAYRKER